MDKICLCYALLARKVKIKLRLKLSSFLLISLQEAEIMPHVQAHELYERKERNSTFDHHRTEV
jgi:hypothetical protein